MNQNMVNENIVDTKINNIPEILKYTGSTEYTVPQASVPASVPASDPELKKQEAGKTKTKKSKKSRKSKKTKRNRRKSVRRIR